LVVCFLDFQTWAVLYPKVTVTLNLEF